MTQWVQALRGLLSPRALLLCSKLCCLRTQARGVPLGPVPVEPLAAAASARVVLSSRPLPENFASGPTGQVLLPLQEAGLLRTARPTRFCAAALSVDTAGWRTCLLLPSTPPKAKAQTQPAHGWGPA